VIDKSESKRDGTLEVRLPSPLRRTSARGVRAALQAYLSDHELGQGVVDDVLLATEEALVNAMLHSGGAKGGIVVSASVRGGDVTVEVSDAGRGFDPGTIDPDRLPDPGLVRGRGLFLMHHLMDEVDVRCGSRGTTVHMTKHAA
jgi:serine/threonine-protein kinase RsbW